MLVRQADIHLGWQLLMQVGRYSGGQANVGQAGRYSFRLAVIEAGGKIFSWQTT
jgi:hypothetical protein